MIYTMDIETVDGVSQHPFHLGTIHAIAENFVLERLAADQTVRSIALRLDRRCVGIYDWRALDTE
jgi:hypothetical protein